MATDRERMDASLRPAFDETFDETFGEDFPLTDALAEGYARAAGATSVRAAEPKA